MKVSFWSEWVLAIQFWMIVVVFFFDLFFFYDCFGVNYSFKSLIMWILLKLK